MKVNLSQQRGQTLVGTLMATVTLVLLVVSVTGAAVATTRLLTENRRQVAALAVVNEKIEFIKSLPYGDIGFVAGGGDVPAGIIEAAEEVAPFGDNADGFVVLTSIEFGDDGDNEDFKEIVVEASWIGPNGREREVRATTFIAPVYNPLDCSFCPGNLTCDQSVGVCLPTSEVPAAAVLTDEENENYCVPGHLCPDGQLCLLNSDCRDAVEVPTAGEGEACTPGQTCSNGALCSLSGVCPSETCLDGICANDGVCFSNFCYNQNWYEVSWPANDNSGPGSSTLMMCQDEATGGIDSCQTSTDCPKTCVADDGAQVIWQCEEQTWIPHCRLGAVGGANRSCRGEWSEDGVCQGELICQGEPCPASGVCAINGQQCGISSSNAACVVDDQCPVGEMCQAGSCRTICASEDDEQCRLYWGGFERGCRPYAITGAAETQGLDSCGAVLGLTALNEVAVELLGPEDAFFDQDGDGFYELVEGNTGLIEIPLTVSLLPDTADGTLEDAVSVRVDFSGEASLATDYDFAGRVDQGITLYFAVGDDLTKQISLQISGDLDEEINEKIIGSITAARSLEHAIVINQSEVHLNIVNDDVSVAISDALDVTEGSSVGENQAQFTVTRLGSIAGSEDGITKEPLTVAVTVETKPGTAQANEDFIPKTTAGGNAETIIFNGSEPAGAALADPADGSPNFFVDIIGDSVFEEDEQFSAEIVSVNPVDVRVADSSGLVTILDDDFIIDLLDADPVDEGDVASDNVVADFRLQFRGRIPSHDVTVDLVTQEGSAKAGEDFVGAALAVTIPAGSSSWQASVEVVEDQVREEPAIEDFFLKLDSVNGASKGTDIGRATIVDDEPPPPVITIANDPIRQDEGDSGTTPMNFLVQLSNTFDQPVVVQLYTFAFTATPGQDYIDTSQVLTFPPGLVEQFFTVPIIGDEVVEPEERFFVFFCQPGALPVCPENGSLGETIAVGRIRDDD